MSLSDSHLQVHLASYFHCKVSLFLIILVVNKIDFDQINPNIKHSNQELIYAINKKKELNN